MNDIPSAAQEVVALNFELDQLLEGYNRQAELLRLTGAALEQLENENAVLIAERSFTKGETTCAHVPQ